MKDLEFKKLYDALEPEFNLACQLIEARIASGLSQAELAKKLKTKQSAISRLESGRANPTINFLRKTAKILKKNVTVTIA